MSSFVFRGYLFSQTSNPQQYKYTFTVAKDGSGEYKYIQDAIFASGENSNQLFLDCYIEGTTDFIFGPSTALFQNCTISAKSNSYITAANTTQVKKVSFVFLDCKIIADSSVSKVYLGRPWRSWAKTVFVRCELPK